MKASCDLPEGMRALGEKFYALGDAFANEFIQTFGNQPAPPFIYHYTDDKGLRGILETGTIWLTDIFALNDPTELRHGIEHAIARIAELAGTGAPEFKLFARRFAKIRDGGIERSAHYFVACLSKRGDDLGQWRAYADDGKGFALGFEGNRFEHGFATPSGKPAPNNSTFPVTYDDSQLRELQEKILGILPEYVSAPRGRGLSDAAVNAYIKHLSVCFSVLVFWVSLYFKHPAYMNEAEYRFLQIQRGDRPAEGVKSRSRPHGLVRYVEYDWKQFAPGALKEIIIGPAADRRKSETFARDCLRLFGIDEASVDVRFSSIPYRGRS
jgi:hypothetical protein